MPHPAHLYVVRGLAERLALFLLQPESLNSVEARRGLSGALLAAVVALETDAAGLEQPLPPALLRERINTATERLAARLASPNN